MSTVENDVINGVTSTLKKMGFWGKLLDKNNSQVSSTNFFVITVTLIGLLLLLVPVFILCIEAWYNHTITTDLNGLAAYIGAVAMMFVTVGATKAWVTNSDNKLKESMGDTSSCDI